ncbi:hypothetical protein [Rhizobium sp. L245/93]|uniref:AbiTii domain-containing protein n=1 Tax=Rhizobium sp. L245/93 TaxID=2819998 RepID=UPI001ADCD473|nr:hypothetical protein [Rhizobium sp. L245/93]MBO9166794.1 hypothetical protein [Rhizobium sp. L245/93]
MTGLVEEIQAAAIDDAVPVSTLLRKVKLAAVKLQLPKVEAWVECELNGYGDGEVPDYRRFTGVPKAYNPVRGWIDIHADARIYSRINKASTGQSIATIEQLVADQDGRIVVPMDRELIDIINANSRVAFARMAVHLGRADVAAIIDHVRNLVLNWAIELERNGILGEGISFSQTEKEKAHQVINIGTFNGVMGNDNQVGNIVGEDMNNVEPATRD